MCVIAVAIFIVLAINTISNGKSTANVSEGQAPADTATALAECAEYMAVQMTETTEEATQEISARQEDKPIDFSGEESEMLLKIAMAEAEGESVEGKALVMLVVLNRVASKDFPDTVQEVIFQENQFSTVAEGGRYYTTEPNAECYEALEMIAAGWDESMGALYFESCVGESWQSRNLELLFECGNHRFYR